MKSLSCNSNLASGHGFEAGGIRVSQTVLSPWDTRIPGWALQRGSSPGTSLGYAYPRGELFSFCVDFVRFGGTA